MKIPVVMDCDPGTDDALAILLAQSSDNIEIVAITTVAGNRTADFTSANALKLADFVNSSAKVAKGAERPLIKKLQVSEEWMNGAGGLGNAVLPESTRQLYEKNAVETIYEAACEYSGKLNIIATGPLTNIALLVGCHPDVCEKIEHITLMGGAYCGGNATPCAEFNIYTDPDAAKIVFKSGIPITMVGLDATKHIELSEQELWELISFDSPVAELTGLLMGYLPDCKMPPDGNGIIMFDVLAAAAVINKNVLETKSCNVDVETSGELTNGQTVVEILKDGETGNADVGFFADKKVFLDMLKKMFAYYRENPLRQ